MKVYVRFIILSFLKSLMLVSIIFFTLVFILNTLTEVEFFNEIKVEPYFPIYISYISLYVLIFSYIFLYFRIFSYIFPIFSYTILYIPIFSY